MQFLIVALAGVATKIFDFIWTALAYKAVKTILIGTAVVASLAALYLAAAVALKAAIVGLRVVMPGMLSELTYFLPANINHIFATIVVARLGWFVASWARENLKLYSSKIG